MNPFETALFASSVKRLKPRCIEGPLEIHILDVEMNGFAPFCPFDGKVKPSPIQTVIKLVSYDNIVVWVEQRP